VVCLVIMRLNTPQWSEWEWSGSVGQSTAPLRSTTSKIDRETERQTRPDQTRPDQTRPDQTRHKSDRHQPDTRTEQKHNRTQQNRIDLSGRSWSGLDLGCRCWSGLVWCGVV